MPPTRNPSNTPLRRLLSLWPVQCDAKNGPTRAPTPRAPINKLIPNKAARACEMPEIGTVKTRSAITGNSTQDVPAMLTPALSDTSAASFGSCAMYLNPARTDDQPAALSSGCRLASSACDSTKCIRLISSAETTNDSAFNTKTASLPSQAATTPPRTDPIAKSNDHVAEESVLATITSPSATMLGMTAVRAGSKNATITVSRNSSG